MASKTNRVEVPEAKAAMDRFKTEEAGSIGGEMVRRMIKKQEEQMK